MKALTLTMPEACEVLNISTDLGYKLVREDQFPAPVLRLGRKIVVPTGPLAQVLGMSPDDIEHTLHPERATTPGPTPGVVAHQIPESLTDETKGVRDEPTHDT